MTITTDRGAGPAQPVPSLTVPYTDIPVLPWEWLLKGWLPYGVPVLIAAPGGTGKGVLIARMAALVTTGGRWPGDPEGMTREPGSVVLIAPEDDANRTTAPRLLASGADTRFVHDMSVLADGSAFTWPACEDVLRKAIAEVNAKAERAAELGLPFDHPDYMVPVRLVTIDPLYRAVRKRITEGNAVPLVEALERIAAEFGVTLVVSHHTTKDGKTVSGSRALTDAFRAVFRLERDQDERMAKTRHLVCFKVNFAADDGRLSYELCGTGAGTHAEFTEPPEEPETPAEATNRIRQTTAELRAATAARQRSASRRLTSAELPAQSWRVMRRVNRDGDIDGPTLLPLQPWEGESAGKTRAALDAGTPLDWQPAAGLPGGSVASFTRGDGSRWSYAVYPEQDAPAVVG